jgi:hypothetical protein
VVRTPNLPPGSGHGAALLTVAHGVLTGRRVGGTDNWWAVLGSKPELDSDLRPSDSQNPLPGSAGHDGTVLLTSADASGRCVLALDVDGHSGW